jgi:hypothetical protein
MRRVSSTVRNITELFIGDVLPLMASAGESPITSFLVIGGFQRNSRGIRSFYYDGAFVGEV